MESTNAAESRTSCPFREDHEVEGLLCFDPWLDEYARPPEHIVENYCNTDFKRCPIFVAYQRTAALKYENFAMDL